MSKTKKTDVIFRKFKSGEVIALFPSEPGDNDPCTMNSYMHEGQHASAHERIIQSTKPAPFDDYKGLLKELVAIGYDLRVVQKHTRFHRGVRNRKLCTD